MDKKNRMSEIKNRFGMYFDQYLTTTSSSVVSSSNENTDISIQKELNNRRRKLEIKNYIEKYVEKNLPTSVPSTSPAPSTLPTPTSKMYPLSSKTTPCSSTFCDFFNFSNAINLIMLI